MEATVSTTSLPVNWGSNALNMDNVVLNDVATTSTQSGGQGIVPEPSTFVIWSLPGSLAVGLGWWRRRKSA